ncbi:hypothetical protein [Microcoleus sp. AT9b-C5]|uniref:hypothetical protein n=1 Tax=Microcoleus sp. AT9b-C5 TaxID=2818631 RepID=UPI002FD6171D
MLPLRDTTAVENPFPAKMYRFLDCWYRYRSRFLFWDFARSARGKSLPTTSNRSTLIVPGILAIQQAVPAPQQQAAKAVRLKARALVARVMGEEPDLAVAG